MDDKHADQRESQSSRRNQPSQQYHRDPERDHSIPQRVKMTFPIDPKLVEMIKRLGQPKFLAKRICDAQPLSETKPKQTYSDNIINLDHPPG